MTPRLIDTHAHVNFNAFRDDGDEVIERALKAGIGMILIGSQRDTSERAVRYAERYPDELVWAAIGLHPTHLVAHTVDVQEIGIVPQGAPWATFDSREEVFDPGYYHRLAASPKVVAVGEFGLDYHRLPLSNFDNDRHASRKVGHDETDGVDASSIIEQQKNVARTELRLAMDIKKPVLFHCRDAHADLQAIVDETRFDIGRSPKGVVHSFTGSMDEAREWLERDFLIAFNGIITFAPELEEVVRFVPLEKMVVETDSPYLAPVPFRGKRNEPTYVEYVAKKIAEIKRTDVKTVAEVTTTTARSLIQM